MFSGNVYIRGLDELGKIAAEEMLREASQLANLADAKRTSLGVPNFREQFVLSNGATLDVVINEHHSFMNIVGADEVFEEPEVEEEEIEDFYYPLYVFQPKSTHPKVVIYADADSPDGVSMRFGDNIYAGGNYSHYRDNGDDLLISTEKVFHRGYTDSGTDVWRLISNDGPCGGIAGEREAYIRGQTLVELIDRHIIGAALVTYEITDGTVVSMYCFVRYDDDYRNVYFYSHPLVAIPDEPADPTDPLIERADLILVHTINLATYDAAKDTTTKAEVTTCTFNESGTSAVLVQTGKNNADPFIEQTEYTITLSISDDPIPELVISDSSSTDEQYYTNSSVWLPDPTKLPITYKLVKFTGLDSMGVLRQSQYSLSTALDRFYPDTFTGSDGVIATGSTNTYKYAIAMDSTGTILRGGVDFSGTYTSRNVNNILYDGDGDTLGMTTGSPALITVFESCASSFNTSGAQGNDPTTSAYRLKSSATNVETTTYTASWANLSASTTITSDIDVLDRTYKHQISPTYTAVAIYSGGPVEGFYSSTLSYNPTTTLVSPTIYGNSWSQTIAEESHRIQTGLREQMSIALLREDEYPERTFTYDSGTDTYIWGTAPLVLYKQTLVFEAISGSTPIPGLANDAAGVSTGATNTYSFNPRDSINSAYSAPYVSQGWLDYNAPFLPPKVDAPFLPHPKGYCLYSLTDYCMDLVKNGHSPTQDSTAVVGLYIEKTNKFVDILEMYNAMIAEDDILSAILPAIDPEIRMDERLYASLTLPYVGQGSLMYYAGLLDEIHEPTIDYSDYTGA